MIDSPLFRTQFIGLGAGRSQPRRRRLAAFFIFFVLLMMGAGLLGCGSTPVNPSVTNMNATPAGAYAVTVTGTSGAVSHAVNVNLNVN